MDAALYAGIIERRRAFGWPGYHSYADVELDGEWVTPYHLTCSNFAGPVLLTYNYLDAPTAQQNQTRLAGCGYLAEMPFNRVLDLALSKARMKRSDIYVTHAFHLLANSRSERIPSAAVSASFDAVACLELTDRKVIALGQEAMRQCRRRDIDHIAVPHLSARGTSFAQRAELLAGALRLLA